MPDAPGSPDAGFIAYILVSRLIETLAKRGILPKADTIQMLHELVDELGEETRALSKPSADFIRDRLLPRIDTK
jgi:hypothetical protein